MISYWLSYLVISFFLWVIYKVVLEKNRSFIFNRIYLLISLVLPLLIPVININFSENIALSESIVPLIMPSEVGTEEINLDKEDNEVSLIFFIYIFISVVLLIRFFKNLLPLMKAIRSSEKIMWNNCTLVLTIDGTSSFSFLSYIFIPKVEYESELYPKAILEHEQCHVEQGHTIDIILAEVISILFWFNPTIYLFKRSIRLNHEFLADQYVLKRNSDPIDYSLLIIKYVESHSFNILVSSFNFSFLKKRFIMITKVQKKKAVLLRQFAILPAFILIFMVFGGSNKAQINSSNVVFQKDAKAIDTSEENRLVAEYINILKKASLGEDEYDLSKFLVSDKKRLKEIFHECSKQAQNTLMNTKVLPKSFSIPKNGVSEENLKKWLEDNSFKIIIDMKLMNKAELSKIKAEDFIGSHVGWWDRGKQTKNKKIYGAWLYTHKSFDADNEIEIMPKIEDLWPGSKGK